MFMKKSKKEEAPKVEEKAIERVVYRCPVANETEIRARVAEADRMLKQAQEDCNHPFITQYLSYYVSQTCTICRKNGENIRNAGP